MVRLARHMATCLQLFIKIEMVIFVFVVVVAACACSVVARDGVSWLSALSIKQVLCVWPMAQLSRGCVFLLFFAVSLLHVLLLILTFSSREIWGMNRPNLPEVSRLEDLLVLGCICCTCVMAIDSPLTMIVIVGWVLLWYSQCPHNAFIAFVGEAALWLQGWLPQLSLSL